MSQSTDWLPNSREGVLTMAQQWVSVAGGHAGAWDISAAALTELGNRITAAESALKFAKDENNRTPVATARCKEAFDALSSFMRDFKRRYFLSPPLTDADFVSLGLKPHDTKPTPSGKPTAHVMAESYLIGRHELGLKMVYIDGSPGDPANKGYRVWYKVVAPGETPPADPETDLPKSFFTRRKKDVIEFDFGDSGKTAYFAVQVENDGTKGPWGPLVNALIP